MNMTTTEAERDGAGVAASDAIEGDDLEAFKKVGSWWRRHIGSVSSRRMIAIMLEHADVR